MVNVAIKRSDQTVLLAEFIFHSSIADRKQHTTKTKSIRL